MKIWQKKNAVWDGLNGILIMVRDEVQFPWQVGFVVCAVVVALLLGVRGMELIALITCCCLALAGEIINTAIEELCDKVEPSYDTQIGRIKDIAAGFVIIISLPAVIAVVAILGPRII